VVKGDGTGVEVVAARAGEGGGGGGIVEELAVAAVEGIAQKGDADAGEVDSDLVGAPGY